MPSIHPIRVAILCIACALANGCATSHKQAVAVAAVPPPTTRPVVKAGPMLDVSRGGVGVPLEDATVLHTRDDLQNGIRKAFEHRMTLPPSAEAITVEGDGLQALDLLKVDISNSTVKDDFHPAQNKKPTHPEPAIAVKQFEYRAWPVYYQKLATYWRMEATDAKFGLLRDSAGHQTLVLTDAREGSFEFAVSLADLSKPRVIVNGPTTSRSSVGVKDVDFQVTSDNPHMLAVQVKIKATFLLLPMTFRMSARADIDPWCNVKLSGLSCEGLDPGGLLFATFVNSSLQKYNGQLISVARWPEDRVELTDVQFKVDDSLHVSATFAGEALNIGGIRLLCHPAHL